MEVEFYVCFDFFSLVVGIVFFFCGGVVFLFLIFRVAGVLGLKIFLKIR